jgi:uncharacterized linocin/CFP29 family protein
MLTENEYNLLYEAVLNELEPILVGPRVVAKSDSLPLGIQSITINELKKLKGKAKRGQKGAPIPREVAEFQRKTVSIIEHAYGFHLDDQDLLASRRSKIPLETGAARQCARIVAESIEDMIFNGIPELGIKGIYNDTNKSFDAPNPWDSKDGNPYEDVISMVSQLSENGRYRPKFMVLSPDAYYALAKTNNLGVSYLKMIEDAGFFPNGRNDIYMAPANANPIHDPIIPAGGGLIGDFGNNIAERYVQQTQANRIEGEEEHYSDIYLRDFPMNSNNLWEFNVQTYQGLGVHFNAAFLKLGKLTTSKQK